MSDSRTSPRFDKFSLTAYEIHDANGLAIDHGMARTLDLSVDGVLLELPRNPPESSTIEISIDLDDQIVKVSGAIRHVEPTEEQTFQVGIAITENDRQFKQYLAQLEADEP